MLDNWEGSGSWKISKEELYHILRKIVGFESSNVDISWRTSIFHWIDCTMLLNKLLKHRIGILEFAQGDIIIPEGKWDCNYFFLLLKWELGIYIKDTWITDINVISVVWEIGFLTKSERTATVKAKTNSYLLPLDQFFIDSLSSDAQSKIYRNLAIETWRKLNTMNKNTCVKNCMTEGLEKFPDNWEVNGVVKDTVERLEVIGKLII